MIDLNRMDKSDIMEVPRQTVEHMAKRFQDSINKNGMNCKNGYDTNLGSQWKFQPIYNNDRNTKSTKNSDLDDCSCGCRCLNTSSSKSDDSNNCGPCLNIDSILSGGSYDYKQSNIESTHSSDNNDCGCLNNESIGSDNSNSCGHPNTELSYNSYDYDNNDCGCLNNESIGSDNSNSCEHPNTESSYNSYDNDCGCCNTESTKSNGSKNCRHLNTKSSNSSDNYDCNCINTKGITNINSNHYQYQNTKSIYNSNGYDFGCLQTQNEHNNDCRYSNTKPIHISNNNDSSCLMNATKQTQLQPPIHTKQCNYTCKSQGNSWWHIWKKEKSCTPIQLDTNQSLSQQSSQNACFESKQQSQAKNYLPKCTQKFQSSSICKNYPNFFDIPKDHFTQEISSCKWHLEQMTRRLHQKQEKIFRAKTKNLEAMMHTIICRKCPDIRCRKPLKQVNNWHLGICGSPAKCRRCLKQTNHELNIEDLHNALLYTDDGNSMKKATEMNLSSWNIEDLEKEIQDIDNQDAMKISTNMCNNQQNSIRSQLNILSKWSTKDLEKEIQNIDNKDAIEEITHKYKILLNLIKDHNKGKPLKN